MTEYILGVMRVDDFVQLNDKTIKLRNVWAPVQALAALLIGSWTIGYAFTIGVELLLVVFVPLQICLMKRFAVLRLKV